MSFTIINSALTDQLVTALCGTLIWSLIQGVALALAAGLIIVFTRKASSAARYNLLIGALLLFALGSAITFGVQFGHIQKPLAMDAVNHFVPANKFDVPLLNDHIQISAVQPAAALVKQSFITTASAYLNANRNTIVLIWFLIICIKCMQLAVGLQGTYRLKRSNIFAIKGSWENKVAQMSLRLGIKQKIALLESGLAKVPMVIGHLKPAILMPIGLLTALSMAEVEAILMHELAHIRRRDYLVNLLHGLVEIVFFFNPAVLWVSQLIKTERENCCDDMALAQGTSKVSYIRALVSCEEYQQIAPAYAMAFPGQKNRLVERVKRMVENNNNSLNMFEKTLLTICLVLSGLCFSAFAGREQIKQVAHKVIQALVPAVDKKHQQGLSKQIVFFTDQHKLIRQNTEQLSSGKQPTTTNPTADTDRIAKIISKNNHIDSLRLGYSLGVAFTGLNVNYHYKYVNDERTNYEVDTIWHLNHKGDTVKHVNVRVNADPKVKVSINPKVIAKVDPKITINVNPKVTVTVDPKVKVSINPKVDVKARLDSLSKLKGALSPKLSPALGKLGPLDTVRKGPSFRTFRMFDTVYKSMMVDQEERLKADPNHGIPTHIGTDAIIAQLIKDGLMTKEKPVPFSIKNGEFTVDGKKQSAEITRKYMGIWAAGRLTDIRPSGHSAKSTYMMNHIAVQLANDGIIKDGERLSFRLNNTEFVVNGQKQPEMVYKKYFDEFIRPLPNSKMNYSYNEEK